MRGFWLGILVGAGASAIGSAGAAWSGERTVVPPPTLVPCPSQGAGFVRIPGGTTCLRLSGRVAAGSVLARGARRVPAEPLALGRLSVDTRSDTEYGPVRTFVRMGAGHWVRARP